MSEEAKILVKELLTMDPENRHTAEKTLRSRWHLFDKNIVIRRCVL